MTLKKLPTLVDNWIGPGMNMTVNFLFISFPTVDFQENDYKIV